MKEIIKQIKDFNQNVSFESLGKFVESIDFNNINYRKDIVIPDTVGDYGRNIGWSVVLIIITCIIGYGLIRGIGKFAWFAKKDDDFYRGGPAEQELYDRISYDDVLTISIDGVQCSFEYADNFTRIFYTDGRKRQSSANSFYSEGGEDFSLSYWENKKLIVEARPRDGGFTLESYSLSDSGNTLTIAMQLEPSSFGAAINLVRVFNRSPAR